MGMLNFFKEEFMKGFNQDLKGISEEEKRKMGFWESVEANIKLGMQEGARKRLQEEDLDEENLDEENLDEEEIIEPETFSQQNKPGARKYRLGMQAFCDNDTETAVEYFLASAAEGNSDALLVLGDISRKALETDLAETGTIYFSFQIHNPAPLEMSIRFYLLARHFQANEGEVLRRINLISKYFQDTDQFTYFVLEQMKQVNDNIQKGNFFEGVRK